MRILLLLSITPQILLFPFLRKLFLFEGMPMAATTGGQPRGLAAKRRRRDGYFSHSSPSGEDGRIGERTWGPPVRGSAGRGTPGNIWGFSRTGRPAGRVGCFLYPSFTGFVTVIEQVFSLGSDCAGKRAGPVGHKHFWAANLNVDRWFR